MVEIKLYRWAGQWGPFKVNIPCGECRLTSDILSHVLENDLADIPVTVVEKDWLSHWWQPLKKGAWHAPIVLVNNRLLSQGVALNRGLLIQAIIEAEVKQHPLEGNHLFGQQHCPHCQQAKKHLDQQGIDYLYHDVIKSERALYEMLARVKPIIGKKTPVTVPQIWLNGHYVGGADRL